MIQEETSDSMRSSQVTKNTLEKALMHETWVSEFRNSENEKFFTKALNRILDLINAKPGERILDAGCGSGTKALILATHGMEVTAADFSSYVLDKARVAAEQAGLLERMQFSREDLLSMSFADDEFPYVLCWGVVMHIPDYKRALDELSRVVGPGGYLILSEGNVYSVQSIMMRTLKRMLGRERAEVVPDEIGIEFWEESEAGRLMTRQTDVSALVRAMERRGFELEKRFAGQFSELYMVVRNRFLRRLIHAFNSFWFNWIRTGRMAYGNLLVFKKT